MINIYLKRSAVMLLMLLGITSAFAQQHSVAMQWNETHLSCIRKDNARPTVNARTLFHSSVVMYDAWAAYDDNSATVMLGQTFNGFYTPFDGIVIPTDRQAAQEKAISYAMYRFMKTRYVLPFVPYQNLATIQGYIDGQMASLGYDTSITSIDYSDGDPAKLGNYIAAKMQEYALQDGANQQGNYANLYYQQHNEDLHPQLPGNPGQTNPNTWQRISLLLTLDQSTLLPIENGQPALSPEWGNVAPFALTSADVDILQRDGHNWNVYHNPGPPPLIDTNVTVPVAYEDDFFRWGNLMVSVWHAQHVVDDTELIDISPANIGNNNDPLPTTFDGYKNFYNFFEGGDNGLGYTTNAITGTPYTNQFVPKGDYTRVLSEFWADGPNSETPPGHWFFLANYVSNHPSLEKRWNGQGPILSDLEWDVRTYLTLGGGIHDAAIACWGAKGYYDYTRPISAIRYMCEHGQCSNPELPNYDPAGIPLLPGYAELVEVGDPLAGASNENVGKVKLYTFQGPVAQTGLDGIGWILGENWWTFQVSTFVTPPFPGYYSGHSTYSRTGAEIMQRITGSEYFPGGMGEFIAPAGTYLRASAGPSQEVKLQWAKYKDASDQCSLSRIYGGLHPPQDDIPGRIVGTLIGPSAFDKANALINASMPRVVSITPTSSSVLQSSVGSNWSVTFTFSQPMNTTIAPNISFPSDDPSSSLFFMNGTWTSSTTYVLAYIIVDTDQTLNNVQFKISGAEDLDGHLIFDATGQPITIDTDEPVMYAYSASPGFITDTEVGTTLSISVIYDQIMDISSVPSLTFTNGTPAGLALNADLSGWENEFLYTAVYDVVDMNEAFPNLGLNISGGQDLSGNPAALVFEADALVVDTQNPSVAISTTATVLNDLDVSTSSFTLTFSFDQMIVGDPIIEFGGAQQEAGFYLNLEQSTWVDPMTYVAVYDLIDNNVEVGNIQAVVSGVMDEYGNIMAPYFSSPLLIVDTYNPSTIQISASDALINDALAQPANFTLTYTFDDDMDTLSWPDHFFLNGSPNANTLVPLVSSHWVNSYTFVEIFDVLDNNITMSDLGVLLAVANDIHGNTIANQFSVDNLFSIDTRNPQVTNVFANNYNITSDVAPAGFSVVAFYDEEMSVFSNATVTFPVEDPSAVLSPAGTSAWYNTYTSHSDFTITTPTPSMANIDIVISGATDLAGNLAIANSRPDFFNINTAVSVSELAVNSKNIRVYPNPVASGRDINIAFEHGASDALISLMDISGRMVSVQRPNTNGSGIAALSTQGLSAGTYLLRVVGSTDQGVYKVVVE